MPNSFQGFPAVPKLPWDDLYVLTLFESLDSVRIAEDPEGGVSFSGGGLQLQTAGNPDDYCAIRLQKPYCIPIPSWGSQRLFRARCLLQALNYSDGIFEIGLAGIAEGLQLGFRVDGGKLYAIPYSINPAYRVLLEDWGAAGFDKTTLFEVRFNPGAYAQFYVDGILKTTIVDHLPVAGDYAGVLAYLYLKQGDLGPVNSLLTNYWMFWQEA